MWKVLTMAFRTAEGEIMAVKFVVMVSNGDQLLITEDTIISIDTVGTDRGELEGWEYIGSRTSDLEMEV